MPITRITKISVSFLFLSSLFTSGVALASSCINETFQQIRFKTGAYCWEYEGKATTFGGDFVKGQTVVVSMQGLASYGVDNGGTTYRWEDRHPNVGGPNGFSEEAMDGNTLRIRLPYTGTYIFGFSPCAMWHGYGKVRICT